MKHALEVTGPNLTAGSGEVVSKSKISEGSVLPEISLRLARATEKSGKAPPLDRAVTDNGRRVPPSRVASALDATREHLDRCSKRMVPEEGIEPTRGVNPTGF